MRHAIDGETAKKIDSYTINNCHVPSVVLMERAAESVAVKIGEVAINFNRKVKIAAVCGSGNNGADGIAAARILSWQGLAVDIIAVGNESHATEEYMIQKQIANSSGMNFETPSNIENYDIIIDAMFGVGLSREVTGTYKEIIQRINNSCNYTISVDIPSGIDAHTGHVLGCAVMADATITFGYNKIGMMLYPGKKHAGEITVSDIGFYPEAVNNYESALYFTEADLMKIPERVDTANKGTYGRTVIIAGSEDMSGAAYLSGLGAFRCGAGLVEIVTFKSNVQIIREMLPEAIVTGYNEEDAEEIIIKKIEKATEIIVGPGISTSALANKIVECIMTYGKVPAIIDADALNILANNKNLLKNYGSEAIITPHIGEMSRLTGIEKEELSDNMIENATNFAKEYGVICVLKNAVTVIADKSGRTVINNSGNSGMAKAGSGDVLTGIIAGMLALKIEPFSAAAMGVFVHGLAGDYATEKANRHSLIASDIANAVGNVLRKNK